MLLTKLTPANCYHGVAVDLETSKGDAHAESNERAWWEGWGERQAQRAVQRKMTRRYARPQKGRRSVTPSNRGWDMVVSMVSGGLHVGTKHVVRLDYERTGMDGM